VVTMPHKRSNIHKDLRELQERYRLTLQPDSADARWFALRDAITTAIRTSQVDNTTNMTSAVIRALLDVLQEDAGVPFEEVRAGIVHRLNMIRAMNNSIEVS